ncbi:hypothetical protein [Myxococcus sp. RHSTA-1-4]|uniref:hypothetical protein n=1 Tax=Myxococcus sp. RHSTA-1-4 TaxID=2874601 RepID=UPI001CC147A0|nr:hypothetical protein [Myxococcus sp. RHSTA-1-4]MBZ4418736.1 hypothetical protein [Myxococcus sp. RHSTA-1-4]
MAATASTSTQGPSEPAASPPPVEIAAPPSTPFVVQESRCLKEPCLVCVLRKTVEDTAATKDVKFATAPLQLNIVGVRSEDSLSNRFDDLMVVFFQLLPPESGPAFTKALEAELLEDMKGRLPELKKTPQGGFRYVACSQQGLWVVGLFTLSTDPGFEDSPEALEEQKAKYEEQLKTADETVKKLSQQEAALTREHEKAKSARAALLAKRKKSAPPPKPELPGALEGIEAPTMDATSLRTYIQSVKKRLDELAAARKVQETHPGLIQDKQKALDAKTYENEVKKGNMPTFQRHKGWVEQGRAIVPVGHHAGAYRFYLHKAGGNGETFPRATVALTVPFIEKGMRIYSVKYLCTATHKKLGTDFVKEDGKKNAFYLPRELRQLWPDAGAVQRYAPGVATLELVDKEPPEGQKSLPAGTPPREVFLVEDGGKKRTLLALEARVVVTDAVNGTNIHRAHNVSLSDDRTKLDGYAARPDAEVNAWSEGCQTFTDFFEFNAFIRLSAISKRWRCASKNPMCIGADACMRLVAGPGRTVEKEADMQRGEKELLARFKEPYIHRAMAVDCRKDAEGPGAKLEKLRKDRDALVLTSEEQAQFDALEARKAQTATAQARAANPKAQPLSKKEEGVLSSLASKREKSLTPETVAEIQKLDASIQEVTAQRQALVDCALDAENEVRLFELPTELARATSQVNEAQSDVNSLQARLDAVPEKGKKPLSPKARERLESRLKEKKEDLEEAQARKQALEEEQAEREKTRGLDEATLRRRREFLRERAQFFRADFLRNCDLYGTCKVDFDYTLVEMAGPRLEELKRQFKDDANKPWPGGFVMGQEPVAQGG